MLRGKGLLVSIWQRRELRLDDSVVRAPGRENSQPGNAETVVGELFRRLLPVLLVSLVFRPRLELIVP